jgi:nucleoside-diphosphate-sugar epimerase
MNSLIQNNMRKKISILGCGWLGTALGLYLFSRGWAVKGSSASQGGLNRLETTGIDTFYLKVEPDSLEMDYMNFFNTDVLVISLPPQRRENITEVFPRQIDQVIQYIRRFNIPKVVFISSTSVYKNINGTVREGDEGSPDKPVGYALLEAETKLLGLEGVNTAIVRFGGLIGIDRNLSRNLANKQNVAAGAPMNLIHRNDCVRIISEIILQEVWGEVFNACCPEHPTKQEYYTKAAEISNVPLPGFTNGTGNFKIVNSDKLIRQLGYTFEYPTPMDYLKELEEWHPHI